MFPLKLNAMARIFLNLKHRMRYGQTQGNVFCLAWVTCVATVCIIYSWLQSDCGAMECHFNVIGPE